MHIGIGALGQTCIDFNDDGSCAAYDTSLLPGINDPTDCLYGVSPSGGCAMPPSSAAPTPTITTPSSTISPASSTSLWAQLTNSLANIAAPVVKQATTQAPYYITNPATGQSVLYNPSTGAVGGTTGSSLATALSSSGDLFPLLLLGGLLLVMMEGGHR